MKATILTFICLAIPTVLSAQEIMMGPLCSCVSDRRQDTRDESPYEYEFEERIYKMAGADITKDSKEVINTIVHNLWVNNEKKMICDETSFNVMKGNILKTGGLYIF